MFAKETIRRVIKDTAERQEKEMRVSGGAVDALSDELEEYAIKIAKRAINLAEHAGRRTIQKEDIELAVGYISQ